MADIKWKQVDWKQTFVLNLQRAVGAGCVFGLLFLVAILSGSANDMPLLLPFVAPFVFPLGYFTVYMPMGLVFLWLGERVPFGWALSLIGLLLGLLVTAGDPLVFLLRSIKPEWVPVKKFSIINVAIVVFVYYETQA